MQGAEPSLEALREARDAVRGEVPVLLNTGAKSTNVREYLAVADGVIVGSDLKRDGYTWNPVERDRVERFLAAARA
jgi:predicted TIM-barrel enzyme